MNAATLAVLKQISSSPVTSLGVTALVATWVRLFSTRTDPSLYLYSYSDLVIRQQWWKLLTAPFCQSSFLSLLFNSITLWGIRSIEVTCGSWYFLRYSILLMAIGGLLTTLVIHLIITYSSPQHPFRNISTGGFSGIIVSWLAYQQISRVMMNHPFYLFGILPLPWDLAPLFVILITPSFLNPKTVTILNIVSLLSGHMLSFGLFAILPDVYWSTCFLFNTALYLFIKSSLFNTCMSFLNTNTVAAVMSDSEQGAVEQLHVGRGSSNSDIEMGLGGLDMGVSESDRDRASSSSSRGLNPGASSRPPRGTDGDGGTSNPLSPLLGHHGSGRSERIGQDEHDDDEEEEGTFEGRRFSGDLSPSHAWNARR